MVLTHQIAKQSLSLVLCRLFSRPTIFLCNPFKWLVDSSKYIPSFPEVDSSLSDLLGEFLIPEYRKRKYKERNHPPDRMGYITHNRHNKGNIFEFSTSKWKRKTSILRARENYSNNFISTFCDWCSLSKNFSLNFDLILLLNGIMMRNILSNCSLTEKNTFFSSKFSQLLQ